MEKLFEHIYNGNFDAANSLIEESMVRKLRTALHASKKKLAAKKFTSMPVFRVNENVQNDDFYLDEEALDEGRIAIVRARIRGGKVQRRKKVSTVTGMTMRGGKLVRMSAAERRRRKMGARKAKLKARAKKVQMLRKRKLSLMKRKRLGL